MQEVTFEDSVNSYPFEYGGKHFVPVRKFEKRDGDFYQITRRLKRDLKFGFFRADLLWEGRAESGLQP